MEPSPSKRPAADDKAAGASAKKPKKDGAKGDSGPKKAPSAAFELQKSILNAKPELSAVFLDAMRTKPDGISKSQFTRQFWSTRQHLLRAHAFELEQQRGMRNVLTEFKGRDADKGGAAPADNLKSLKVTPEQLEDLFRLHPVVRVAYNDTVPDKFPDSRTFWQAFFTSRLYQKLRGERIRDEDRLDPVLDKYLAGEARAETHIPHFIDLAGNEQNHSQRQGNQPDRTMRPGASADKVVDILRALNTTSERIMANAARTDGPAFAPAGLDESAYNQLRLHDLQADAGEKRVRLNIRDQHALSAAGAGSAAAGTRLRAADAAPLLADLQSSFREASRSARGENSIDLSARVDFPADDDDGGEDSDSDDGEGAAPAPAAAATQALRRATAQIQALIAQQTDLVSGTAESGARPDVAALARALHMPANVLEDLVLTHQTTNEFLRYFWSVLLSPAGAAGEELAQIASMLDKSLARMQMGADAADEVRKGRLKELQKKAQEDSQRLRRKIVVDEKDAGPGKREVEALMAPMAKAVRTAKARFKDALAAA